MMVPLFAGRERQYLYSGYRQAVAAYWRQPGGNWQFGEWLWDGEARTQAQARELLADLLAAFPTMAV